MQPGMQGRQVQRPLPQSPQDLLKNTGGFLQNLLRGSNQPPEQAPPGIAQQYRGEPQEGNYGGANDLEGFIRSRNPYVHAAAYVRGTISPAEAFNMVTRGGFTSPAQNLPQFKPQGELPPPNGRGGGSFGLGFGEPGRQDQTFLDKLPWR